jgi:pentatricopeptide repeat protein
MEEQILGGTFAFEISNYPYNIVMHAFCKSENADKASEVFTRMKSLADSRNLRELQPDAVSYTTLMKALISEAKSGYMAKVDKLLKEMEESRTTKPDIVIYGTVLNALSMCGEDDAGTRAETFVRRMAEMGVEPNRICYNCIINTYRELGNAAKAKEVLELMEHEGSNGNFRSKPSARDYSACISAYAAEGLPDKEHFEEAHRLFLTVADRYKAGDGHFRSSAAILTSLMDVLAKSEVTGKAKVAKDIWEIAASIDIEYDRRSYNALLKACSEEKGTPEEQLEALELAVKSFQLMRQGDSGVNSTTFVYLMQCCHDLIPDETERTSAIEEFFQNCCDAGIVDEDVISHFHKFIPASALLTDCLKDGVIARDRIPQQWQESVQDSTSTYARR